jgi:hypothetical protein
MTQRSTRPDRRGVADQAAAPQKQLATFIAKYSPAVQRVAHEALATMRARLPGAVELVYDNYNALAIAFGPTDKVADAIFSITLYPRWVSLFFTHGAGLPDPEKILQGNGSRIRHILLDDASVLERLAVRALMAHALERGKPILATRPKQIVIKSVSAKQRPRRPKA